MEKIEKIVGNFINMLINECYSSNDSENIDSRYKNEITSFDDLFNQIDGRGSGMNFFPSNNSKYGCCEVAMFVSFHKQFMNSKFKKDQLIELDEVIKKLVQQVLGTCYPQNRKIILLTDKVDTDVFHPWLGTLKALKKMQIEIGIYYLRSDGSKELINTLVGI